MRKQVEAAIGRAAHLARASVETRIAFHLRLRSAGVLARSLLSGRTGPSLLVRLNASNRPDEEAVVFGAERLTCAELDRRIDQIAAGLRDHGLGSGDAALIIMHNRPEALEAQVAMTRLGGRAVPVSWRSTPDEIEYLVEHSGARAVFVEASVARPLLEAAERLSIPAQSLFSVGGTQEGLIPFEHLLVGGGEHVEARSEQAAVVIYTSGTTGRPKGAVRRFPRTMVTGVLRFLAETPIRPGDRHLVVCPMYHSTAFGFMGFVMTVGGTLVIEPAFDPERVLAAIERERITSTAMVPTMLHRLLELPDQTRRRYDTRSLRAVFSGGAPLSGTLARRFMESFGHVLYNFYGATETGINTLATPEELLDSPGTIGHVVPGNEIRLLDDEGREVPRGSIGELYVKNDMLVAGYYRDEAATRGSMRDGFFSVGDLAHQDEHGLYHIDGRKRDMIISGGVNVYPAEVEEVLTRHPAVAEAAVIGVADEEWGERVRAYVVLHAGKGLDEGELVTWARESLAGVKVPRDVVVVDALPRNATGKVLKRELRMR